MDFHNIEREGLPKKSGRYFTINKRFSNTYFDITQFATDLYKVDNYDFHMRKGKPGWYDYDSEAGYYEVDNVVAWAELPEMPEEYR